MKYMIKLTTALMLLLVSIGFAACSDDDDDDNAPSSTTNSIFDEPYLGWGASKSTVKNKMKKYSLVGEDTEALLYKGTKKADAYGYDFEDNKLYISSVFIPMGQVSVTSLAEVMNENYKYVGKDDDSGLFLYTTKDNKSIVGLTFEELENADYCLISFVKNTSAKSHVDFKSMKKGQTNLTYVEQFDALMK